MMFLGKASEKKRVVLENDRDFSTPMHGTAYDFWKHGECS